MILPALHNWESTRDALHQAARVLGAVRVHYSDEQPNALQHSLNVIGGGLSSGELGVGELVLDYAGSTISLKRGGLVAFTIALNGQSQRSLVDNLLAAFRGLDITPELDRAPIDDETPFVIDPDTAADYAKLCDWVFTVMARFRARLNGPQTPLVVWPHHFDFSFIWFATPDMDEHKAPHMNFGFAPESAGFDRPYFYMYAWPMPEGLTEQPIPAPAYWNTDGFSGMVIDYDDIAHRDDAADVVEQSLLAVCQVSAERMA